jgi:hypothetical protein
MGRADHQQKKQMKKDKEMQFLWRPFPSEFGKNKEILGLFFADTYFPPISDGNGFVYYFPWSKDQPI